LDALESVKPILGSLRAQVHAHIKACQSNGATDDEIEVALDLRHQTASARRRELVQLGFVVDSGVRRPTRSGRKAKVWVTTPPPEREAPEPTAGYTGTLGPPPPPAL
tara:strand:+ start:1276 stop:1596 length:321 start_codon:yes stop_codon:yes gene_type:complete